MGASVSTSAQGAGPTPWLGHELLGRSVNSAASRGSAPPGAGELQGRVSALTERNSRAHRRPARAPEGNTGKAEHPPRRPGRETGEGGLQPPGATPRLSTGAQAAATRTPRGPGAFPGSLRGCAGARQARPCPTACAALSAPRFRRLCSWHPGGRAVQTRLPLRRGNRAEGDEHAACSPRGRAGGVRAGRPGAWRRPLEETRPPGGRLPRSRSPDTYGRLAAAGPGGRGGLCPAAARPRPTDTADGRGSAGARASRTRTEATFSAQGSPSFSPGGGLSSRAGRGPTSPGSAQPRGRPARRGTGRS